MSGASSRRGLALLAASATLGAACITPVAVANATPSTPPTEQRGLLDLDLISILLGQLTSAAQLQGLLSALGLTTPAQLADLLAAADVAKLELLLDGLTTGQLDGALGALSPEELIGMVTKLGTGDLAGVFSLLDPSQITALLGQPGGLTEVIDGLQAVVAGITAGTPAAPAVDALLAQLQALLSGVSPDQLGQLDALLGQIAPLLSVAGLDAAQLGSLTTLLQGLAAGTPAAGVLGLLTILAPAGPGPNPGAGPSPGPSPSATPSPGPGPGAQAMSVRAAIRKVTVAKNRRSAKIKLVCPATAPACLVAVNGKVGARSAFKQRSLALQAGAAKRIVVKLSKPAAKKLRSKKGGTLKVSAVTAYSTLGAATGKAKVRSKRA